MKSFILVVITLLGLTLDTHAQTMQLDGVYRHYKKNEFFSLFNFHRDTFTLVQSGDLGSFYGKGKYKLEANALTLSFDTVNLDRSGLRDYLIIAPKTESLTIYIMNKEKFEIEYLLESGSKYRARYVKRKSHRNKPRTN